MTAVCIVSHVWFLLKVFTMTLGTCSLMVLVLSHAESEIVPGRTLPSECHPEVHSDYDGKAVRWGLTFHVESAADCCQACLDQAKSAKGEQLKCNIWVYCPQEAGCYSPDIYEHKHQECWLKQVLPSPLVPLAWFCSSFWDAPCANPSFLLVWNRPITLG